MRSTISPKAVINHHNTMLKKKKSHFYNFGSKYSMDGFTLDINGG